MFKNGLFIKKGVMLRKSKIFKVLKTKMSLLLSSTVYFKISTKVTIFTRNICFRNSSHQTDPNKKLFQSVKKLISQSIVLQISLN